MSCSSPLPTSSPASSRTALGRRPSPNAQLAFLVHSPETVATRMPPAVENTALDRQQRRRTSKEDEDILKAEYLKNPKPDKIARLEIVRQVALGEKEVQIWFQNKRQNDRRRSRPLHPSSTTSLMSSSSNMSDPATEDETLARETDHISEHKSTEDYLKSDPPEMPALIESVPVEAAAEEQVPETRVEESVEARETESRNTVELAVEAAGENQNNENVVAEPINTERSAPAMQGASQPRMSWISNRRSASFVRHNEDYAPEVITFPNAPLRPSESPETTTTTSRPLKRTHSFVRISTNEDGTARIVTDLDKTPSPPHAKTNAAVFSRAAAGLRRSYSTAGLNERLAAAAGEERSPKIARTSSNIGRSRDSRAWEFWCDPDSRSTTSLTTRAEQEGSGSAADAIGILRANRKVLAHNHTRQNTPLLSRHSSHKVQGSPGVKKTRGPMQRASTISGRIASTPQNKSNKTMYSDSSSDIELPATESDKENWEPECPSTSFSKSSKIQRDPYIASTPRASHRARQILGENTELMSQTSSLGALLARERRQKEVVLDPEQDDELREFMASERQGTGRTTSLSSAEEAGCVEGLLKLSQAQWR